MKILVNERPVVVGEGTRLYELRDTLYPGADCIVVNGFPSPVDRTLREGDRVVFIKRGECPAPEEFEALLTARHTPGVHEKIRTATVGICGLGGLGSSVAVALGRIGIGRLILADFDVVEPSNLNRQCYFVDQIGMPKTEALKATLMRLNPYLKVVTHTQRVEEASVATLFEGVDVMVEALDRAEEKASLVEAFLTSYPTVPVVAASGLAGFGPANEIETRKVMKNLYVCGDFTSEAMEHQGLMAPRVGVAAHHQANAVLRLLLGYRP